MRPVLVADVVEEVTASIGDEPHTKEMEEVKRTDQFRIGLEKLPSEPLSAVPDAHEIEATAYGPIRATLQADKVERQKNCHGDTLIGLNRMAGQAVAQVHAPWQSGWRTIGLIR